MRVLFLYSDNKTEWNSSEWRVVIPCKAINMVEGWRADYCFLGDLVQAKDKAVELAKKADIIVFQRLFILNALPVALHWKIRGKVVIGDVDDAYHLMPQSVPSYPFWYKNRTNNSKTPFHEQLFLSGKVMNAITSPSKILVKDWEKHAHSYFVPNLIDADRYIPFKETHDDDSIVIGWGGSITHLDSFRNCNVFGALSKLLQENENLKVLIVSDDDRIARLLSRGGEQVAFVPKVEFNRWPQLLAKFDIGLLPLSGAYDNRRSWVKAIEYLAMGIPWVGSESPAVEDVRDLGITVQNSERQWKDALRHVIYNIKAYREIAMARSTTYLPRIDIHYQAKNLTDIYRRIYEETKNEIG